MYTNSLKLHLSLIVVLAMSSISMSSIQYGSQKKVTFCHCMFCLIKINYNIIHNKSYFLILIKETLELNNYVYTV